MTGRNSRARAKVGRMRPAAAVLGAEGGPRPQGVQGIGASVWVLQSFVRRSPSPVADCSGKLATLRARLNGV